MVLLPTAKLSAQHTLTLTGGTGVATARFYPAQETKWMWGSENFGLSWRFYSERPRFVGAIGIDLEYLERGFNMGYTYTSEWVGEGNDRKEVRTYQFYNRKINSIMLPLVWQPHFYLAKNRLRIYIEAALVLSYNISSSYSYENDRYPAGKYEWKVPRDNRFGYGLAGGAGFSVLLGQVEIGLRARYHFGYSDILKNRNKYYSNDTDGRENPFSYTPLRSPLDNINLCLTVGWRFNKRGFDEWFVERPKKAKSIDGFNFSERTGKSNNNTNNKNTNRR
ncbi:MAG: outer membrane beta-barrel protein [Alistipes sp.]|nr:outer membrane beta-barrel protein [Alistipes sp.]